MNVLLLGPYPPPRGGVQTNLVAIRKHLLARGARCPVINLTRFRRENHNDIYYPRTSLGVIGLLLRLNYDLIHLHAGGDLSPRHVMLMLLSSLLPGKRVIFTFHSGGYPSSEAGRGARPFSWRGFALRRLDGIIAVNQELVDLFQRFGVKRERIRLIAPYTPAAAIDTALPEPMASFYRAHDPVLVTISGLEPEYDLPLQIEALGKLRARFPNIGLAIVGSGSIEHEIRSLIASQPHRDHILLCGDVPHELALQAIRSASVFLRTTWYDGDSISVREALDLRTPVIATDNGMRPAGVRLIPKSDASALASAIESAIREPRADAHTPASSSANADALIPLATAANADAPTPLASAANLEAVLRFYTEVLEQGAPASDSDHRRSRARILR